MSKYAQLTDKNDATLVLTQEDLDAADAFIDSQIGKIGISPGEVDTNDLLRNIALHYAYYCVAIRSASGQDNLLLEKGDRYRRIYQDELTMLSPTSLGIDSVRSSRLGSIILSRS